MSPDPPRLRISPHAVQRFLERCPDELTGDITGLIFYEVQDALREHRRSTKAPGWCATDGQRTKLKARGTVRYVWNEQQTRAYVLRQVQNDGEAWVVMSTYPKRS